MTVGGMGFIPERLLMMMMMNTGTLCKMYTIPVIIPTVNIHSLVCTTLANTLDCAKLYINCYINPVNVSHFEFALWSKDNTLLCPSHCQLALHVSASFAARRLFVMTGIVLHAHITDTARGQKRQPGLLAACKNLLDLSPRAWKGSH